jgi:Fe2+ transport system protein FeoA
MVSKNAPLATAKPGSFVCVGIDPGTLSPARMNSLGICVGRPLELLSVGDPMIIRVCGTIVGLSRQLAAAVQVAPGPAGSRPSAASQRTCDAGSDGDRMTAHPSLANV